MRWVARSNAKPDLYFTDASNNDVAIVNESDALIYDRPLSEAGLLWSTLVDWWRPAARARGLVAHALREAHIVDLEDRGFPGRVGLQHFPQVQEEALACRLLAGKLPSRAGRL